MLDVALEQFKIDYVKPEQKAQVNARWLQGQLKRMAELEALVENQKATIRQQSACIEYLKDKAKEVDTINVII
jgi:hypothetical protein